jgi:uncharacterized protein YbjT (DUF2867 family)
MILITGATGLVGAAILDEFEKRDEKIRILTRDVSKVEHFKGNPNIEVAIGDMQKPETLSYALKDVDKAVLISSADPFGMADTQMSFIDAAKVASVRYIAKLSCLNPGENSPSRFLQMHAKIEKHLEESGLAWTYIRPAHFMQMYLMNAPTVVAQDSLFIPMADAHVAPVDVRDVAKVFYAVLTTSDHESKVYEMSGPESVTMSEIAMQLSKALERAIHYVNITPEQLAQQLISMGMPEQLADAINELYGERRQGSESKVLLETHKLFGIVPTTFAAFLEQNLTAFQGGHMGQ